MDEAAQSLQVPPDTGAPSASGGPGDAADLARQIAARIAPARAYHAGCGTGLLAASLWDQGVECWGRDPSADAVAQVRPDLRAVCDAGALADPPPGPGTFDVAICLGTLDTMPRAEALAALDRLTQAAPLLLLDTRLTLFWLRELAARGFAPDGTHDAAYAAPHAFLAVRSEQPADEATLNLFAAWVRSRAAAAQREDDAARLRQVQADLAASQAQAAGLQAALRQAQADTVLLAARDGESRQAATAQAASAAAERESLLGRLAQVQHALADAAQRRTLAESALGPLRRDHARVQAERDELAADRQHLAERQARAQAELAEARQAFAATQAYAAGLERQDRLVRGSLSWRATAPLRRVLDGSPRVRGAMRTAVRVGKWGLVWRIPRRLRVRRTHGVMADALRLSGTFDPAAYLAANPDVAEARLDPALHYIRYGRDEGRPLRLPPPPPPLPPLPAMPALAAPPVPNLPAPEPVPEPAPVEHVDPAYQAWIAHHALDAAALDLQRRLVEELPSQPLLSIVTPVYKVAPAVLDDTIRSVVAQTYPYWELCLALGDATDPGLVGLVEAWAAQDSRIKLTILPGNLGISGNSDAALALATGEWTLLLDHDDLLSPDALFEMVRASLADPAADFLYSDKDQVTGDGATRMRPLFKGGWSPDTLLNANYLTHLNMIRTLRLRAIGGWDSSTDGAQDWDLFLRAIGPAGRPRHVPKVLYHWRHVPTSVAVGGLAAKPYAAQGQVRAVTRHLNAAGWPGATVSADGPDLRVAWPGDFTPTVSLLLPGSGPAPETDWPGLEAVCGGEGSPAATLDELAARATGDVLVVWDRGLGAPTAELLMELVGPLANPAIGLVTPMVMQPDGRIEAFGACVVDGRVLPRFGGCWPGGGLGGASSWYGNASLASLRGAALRRADWPGLGSIAGTRRPDLAFTLTVGASHRRILCNPYAVAHAHGPGLFPTLEPDDPLHAAVRTVMPDGDPLVSPNLEAEADGTLRLRVPQMPPPHAHDYTSEAAFLAGAFDATADDIAASRRACAAQPAGPLHRMCWAVPDFDVAFYGGIHTILRTADHMLRQHKVHPTFAVLGSHDLGLLRARIGQAFPALAQQADLQRIEDGVPLAEAPQDALVSTLWTTAFPALHDRTARRKFHFLQDWEPLFYPAGTLSGLVEATYRFGFHAVCNTGPLAESYRALGGTADHFSPAIDPAVFHPRRAGRPPGSPFRLFCYARPTTPRNAFPTLASALRALKARHGDGLDIVTAGAAWSPAQHGLHGVVRHLGLLPYAETGALYRVCDAGLVAMATRHPSYLPLELMACGAAVISNRNPHTGWLLRDGDNATLFEMTAGDATRAVQSLIDDPVRLARQVEAGTRTVAAGHADWAATCEHIHAIFARICAEPA